jgi:hypothetical protein
LVARAIDAGERNVRSTMNCSLDSEGQLSKSLYAPKAAQCLPIHLADKSANRRSGGFSLLDVSHYRYVWSAAELQAKTEEWWFGLRQCIRPLVESKTPGHDGFRPVSSLLARRS